MNSLLTILSSESVLLLGLVSALCAAFGVDEKWQQVALAVIPLVLAIGVRQVTTSPKTLGRVATDAAVETATQLGTTGVGAVGTLTERGTETATTAVSDVLDTVGGLAGSLAARALPSPR